MGSPLAWVNEIELVNGTLLANVWQTECIARIDLTSGHVTHWYLMHGLRGSLSARPSTKPQIDVLNGARCTRHSARTRTTRVGLTHAIRAPKAAHSQSAMHGETQTRTHTLIHAMHARAQASRGTRGSRASL